MKLQDALEAFIRSRQAIACAEHTIQTYRQELGMLTRFLEARAITDTGLV